MYVGSPDWQSQTGRSLAPPRHGAKFSPVRRASRTVGLPKERSKERGALQANVQIMGQRHMDQAIIFEVLKERGWLPWPAYVSDQGGLAPQSPP